MNATQEEWCPAVGCEGIYEVSNLGRVKSLARQVNSGWGARRRIRETILHPWNHQGGYKVVTLRLCGSTSKQYVHILVLTAFRGPRPEGLVCCHNDGDPTNNHLSNLRWDTQSSNMLDKGRHGTDHEANKTHCPRKHEYTPENTYLYRGRRNCRQCEKDRTARRKAARDALRCGE